MLTHLVLKGGLDAEMHAPSMAFAPSWLHAGTSTTALTSSLQFQGMLKKNGRLSKELPNSIWQCHGRHIHVKPVMIQGPILLQEGQVHRNDTTGADNVKCC